MVVIRVEARARLRALAAEAYPDEGCGVLIGVDSADRGRTEVAEVTSGRNLRDDRARDRYELDPGAILAAERQARAQGRDVVGFWHSHPDHPAEPSGFDTERAWADYVYVIVRTAPSGAAEERAWRLAGSGVGFAELAFDVLEA